MMHYLRFQRGKTEVAYRQGVFGQALNAFVPTMTIVPFNQCDGAAAKPVVQPGERIREGQLLARGAENSVNIHSPIPGIVQDFKLRALPDGKRGLCAQILLSGSFDILGRKSETLPWKYSAESQIIRLLEDKGVINTFDRPEPLVPAIREARKITQRILAIRLFDSDPTIGTDSWMYRTMRDTVLQGTAILAKAMDAQTVFFFRTDKTDTGPDKEEQENYFSGKKTVSIRISDRYPAGNAIQLTEKIGRKTGHLIIDPVTAVSVFEAIVKNTPILDRYITLSGSALNKSAVLKVRIGTPLGDLIEECGGFSVTPARILINGILGGTAIYDLDTPVTKYTKSVHILDKDSCPPYQVTACIHCGSCLAVCPSGLDPIKLSVSIARRQFSKETCQAASRCQQCGACSISCPSRIPLTHLISRGKCVETKENLK